MKGGSLHAKLTSNIREVVFGIEDSLVSTLGTVTGVAVGSGETYIVVLSGVVLVFVEALSMAAGSYLSSKTATELYNERARQDETRVLSERVSDKQTLQELFEQKQFSQKEIKIAVDVIMKERKLWLEEVNRCEYRFAPAVGEAPTLSAFVMGFFYICGGLIVLAPYLFLPLGWALPVAVLLTVLCLFLLGVWKASIAGVPKVKSGLEMMLVSLGAAFLGIVLGRLLSNLPVIWR